MLRVLGRTRPGLERGCGWFSLLAALLLGGNFVSSGFAEVTNLSLGQSINLSELTNGLSVQVGDKLFSAFTFQPHGGFLASAHDIDVVSWKDALGNLGISLQGNFWPNLGDTGDVSLTYYVSVTSPGFLISDLHMLYNGTAESMVTEQALVSGVPVAQLEVSNPPTNLYATADIPPAVQLQIRNDIAVRNLVGGGGISYIDQTFSQIPEPSTFALSVAALVTLLLVTRRPGRGQNQSVWSGGKSDA